MNSSNSQIPLASTSGNTYHLQINLLSETNERERLIRMAAWEAPGNSDGAVPSVMHNWGQDNNDEEMVHDQIDEPSWDVEDVPGVEIDSMGLDIAPYPEGKEVEQGTFANHLLRILP